MQTFSLTEALRLMVLACLAALVACGSSSDNFSDPGDDAYRAEALPFTLTGNEAALDLGDPDAVLVAALASLSVGTAAATGDLADLDDGAPAPGRGQFRCDAGGISEGVVTSGGVRRVTLTAGQCFDQGTDSVQDGIIDLSYSQPSGSEAQGEVNYGFGAEPLLFVNGDDQGEADFMQVRGSVEFDGDFDGSPGNATASGLQYFVGKGARPDAGDTFSADRRIEILAGNSGVNFSVDSVEFPMGVNLGRAMSGPVSIAGSGEALDPACRFTAGFSVDTNFPVAINEVAGEDLARNGMLTISTAAGAATVEFDNAGDARVTTPSGAPVTYTAAQVQDFCGL